MSLAANAQRILFDIIKFFQPSAAKIIQNSWQKNLMKDVYYLHTPNTRIIKTRVMIRYCYERYMLGSIDCFVEWDEIVNFCFVEPFYKKTNIAYRRSSLHVLIKDANTYWWKSCWIYRRQLMWCKTRRSKISVDSWVLAKPNQCCTLSLRPWLVLHRIRIFLKNIYLHDLFSSRVLLAARTIYEGSTHRFVIAYMNNKISNTGKGITILNTWIINDNENGRYRQ